MPDTHSDLQGGVDESATQEHVQQIWRGQAGVAIIVFPLFRYKLVYEIVNLEYQTITVQITRMMVTIAYMPPNSCRGKEVEMLKRVQTLKNESALIMGDINAMHTCWDTRTNKRGQQVVGRSTENGWGVLKLLDHTYRARSLTSTPETVLSVGIKQHNQIALKQDLNSGSDHVPIHTNIQRAVNGGKWSDKMAVQQRQNSARVNELQELIKQE